MPGDVFKKEVMKMIKHVKKDYLSYRVYQNVSIRNIH
jgi:hypothetical protein